MNEQQRAARKDILRQYEVSPAARLGAGMEAEVYALGSDSVLKLYAAPERRADLAALQQLYAGLDRRRVPYALPRIERIAVAGELLVTVEQRLPGQPLAATLAGRSPRQIEALLERSLAATRALATIAPPLGFGRYMLLDPAGISLRAHGDWHCFLDRFVARQLRALAPYLTRDVPDLPTKAAQLRALLAPPYQGDYRLIHGDIFPGNLLAIDDEITALLDFGMLTLWGDPLFDVATAWVLFDMYDALEADVRRRYLEIILAALGEQARGLLYRYVLVYSILTANAYSPTCADGHYRWCVANLNDAQLWRDCA